MDTIERELIQYSKSQGVEAFKMYEEGNSFENGFVIKKINKNQEVELVIPYNGGLLIIK